MWLMPHVSLKQCHCQVEFILLDECVSKVVKKIDHLLGLFGLCQRLICEGTITGSRVVDAPCFIKAMPLSSGAHSPG
jgi:hypothetical protein